MLALFAQAANSGGWEASTLDTSFLYNQGNYAEIGSVQITYDVTANIQGQTDQRGRILVKIWQTLMIERNLNRNRSRKKMCVQSVRMSCCRNLNH